MADWKRDGSIWDFAETIQWALVFRQLSKDKPEGWSKMVSDPKMIEQKANEYGITLRAVADEMLRIGTGLKNMYAILDKKEDCADTDTE